MQNEVNDGFIASNYKSGPSKKKIVINEILRFLIVFASSAIYSISVAWFLEPANLISIGLTAVGQIIHYFVPSVPVGVWTLITNIPLCIIGVKFVSPRFVLFTIISVVIQSILLMGWIPVPEFIEAELGDNKLFLAIIAGLFCGVGIAIALRYGMSTGGVDIIAQALLIKKNISIGTVSTVVNIILAVIYGGLIQNNWSITLYTFIFIILISIVVDKIHTGYNAVRVEVITNYSEEVSNALITGIARGCTILDVKGAYTHEKKYDVFMVISLYELEKAKKIINAVDPDAWITVIPVKRIIGAFFKHTII